MLDRFIDPLESPHSEMVAEEMALIASSIPFVGGIISGLANDFVFSRKNARLGKFLEKLYIELKQQGERISENKTNNEDYRNIAEDIFDKASTCRQQEKLDAFRALFINVTFSNAPKYEEALEVASLIDRWQDRHILLIKILDNPWEGTGELKGTTERGTGSINATLKEILTWNDSEITRTWKELYNAGISNTSETGGMMSVSGAAALEHRLTDFGHVVANYIKNPVTDDGLENIMPQPS